jgi:hypothetical protein
VRFLAGEGITQFLDIGSGLPTNRNVHEVAQQVNPAARVVYADIDPVVGSSPGWRGRTDRGQPAQSA